ncbi:MAG: UDP-N-acetylglucosamine 1-carboxyvinyltransferase [Anaeromicrobium sp.]|uniref:UDP-N-acetylglucosamine 1-carboxyvinyltransferase n=1 Tax=Anaeromicrobium sp. TaxID=1929132 RepID=UPI0025FF7683|nr:UDP-N-acetylglucosamine 1-carboxyvinyltransferase [Anaeromicrobium sp.]MCT4593938.1 UDP-N-acetylglucosamine 1-carboxyvinyltransferase [Anaeromicrobium sp.]
MGKFLVRKTDELKGRVKISGAKNSVLPILAASILSNDECLLEEIPNLKDVVVMQELLKALGASVSYEEKTEVIKINGQNVNVCEAPYDLIRKMRASFLVMGPLLAKCGRAKISLPGGCAIGSRPIDLHLKGFEALGAQIKVDHGYIEASAEKLIGTTIYLDFPSVGATENIMMAATLAEGTTIIENVAEEPEIVDLANFLNGLGANIRGAGTDTIKIQGVEELGHCNHTIIPDRIEAGTFMAATAICSGDVEICNVVPGHLKPMIAKLRECGIIIEEKGDSIRVISSKDIIPTDVKTLPYPGFPTDMQSQFMSILTRAKGTSVVIETVFENRFMHVGELKRMGANIKIEGRSAVIEGVKKLDGAQVKATDLRAGAALILAGMVADGETIIDDIYHVDRGYVKIEEKLRSLGANIERIE